MTFHYQGRSRVEVSPQERIPGEYGPEPTPRMPDTSERIVAAALRSINMVVHTLPPPARHHTIIQVMHEAVPYSARDCEQGFVTSEGRFVDRHIAWLLAVGAGQLDGRFERRNSEGCNELFSEDLW